jgi:oligoendopeptidase F
MTVSLRDRRDVPVHETWALEHVFASPAEAERALADLDARVAALAARAGRLAAGPGELLAALLDLEGIDGAVDRARLYHTLPVTTDQGDPVARAAAGRFHALEADWWTALAFVEPELLAVEPERLAAMTADEPGLRRFGPYLARLEERRPHVRSREVEDVLAGADGVFGAFERVRDALAEGDLRFAPVESAAGPLELAPSTHGSLIADPDREVRRQAFEHWTDAFLGVADTLAETYLARVRQAAFEARVRGYPSSEAAALAKHRVPVAVLDAVLEAFERRLPVWHRYWRARRRLLGVQRHAPWDVFAPAPVAPVRVPYERACAWIVESAAPLGEAYAGLLRRGLGEERWVDRSPNRGKRQGAFCDAAPGVHPYVFLSYDGDLASASTLAHEMGHALHAAWWFERVSSLDGLPALSMTVAETASNAQQALLRGHLMRGPAAADPDFELALIDEAFGNLHRYLFVMPTLVRFEREVHAAVGRKGALAAADLTARAAALFAEAYGPEVEVDERVGIAWAEFPHLFEPFYTFQYTVGVAVALAQVARIEAAAAAAGAGGDAGAGAGGDAAAGATADAARVFLEFLAVGGAVPPVELFARLGLDVTTPAPIEAAFDVVEGLVARLEAHAERLGR